MNPETVVEYLQMIVAGIVDFPEDVKVARTDDEMGVLLSLTVNPSDMGKVIGREGAIAKAIRTILRSAGMKHNARVNMKIVEPAGSGYQQRDAEVFGGDDRRRG